ncbi:predicted protein [Uncinocarpus reesii 1704]|uniref:Uncharacterized protein n=1 Tax=Uncinocarpus reesii (strain UAMH 1704) TaxID=336963 RepID=C4JPF1_UNCRE|nr:uncharacterized protein UREG_04533 [Uncinocarpus reesii 1704]EEP79687.1 predicted protein [Uncinocarpus reesii 1704]
MGKAETNTKTSERPRPFASCLSDAKFLPLDLPELSGGLQPLFEHYGIPPDFIVERLHEVTQSSGSYVSPEGSYVSWIHTLCRSIPSGLKWVRRMPDSPSAVPQSLLGDQSSRLSWLRSAYVLRWDPAPRNAPREPEIENRASSASSSSSSSGSVTLICFGAPFTVMERFRKQAASDTWTQAVEHPFQIWLIVLDELYRQMDAQAWNLADRFRGVEEGILNSAKSTAWTRRRLHDDSTFDFVSLHNLAKYCMYLSESFDAMDLTHADLALQHEQYFDHLQAPQAPKLGRQDYHTDGQQCWTTKNKLRHNRGLFKSTRLRVASLEKRINNSINLSFNLVIQRDSKLMLQDSLRMDILATVTLIFLPVATVGV